jgi:hypothetical protein
MVFTIFVLDTAKEYLEMRKNELWLIRDFDEDVARLFTVRTLILRISQIIF